MFLQNFNFSGEFFVLIFGFPIYSIIVSCVFLSIQLQYLRFSYLFNYSIFGFPIYSISVSWVLIPAVYDKSVFHRLLGLYSRFYYSCQHYKIPMCVASVDFSKPCAAWCFELSFFGYDASRHSMVHIITSSVFLMVTVGQELIVNFTHPPLPVTVHRG